MSNYWDVKCLDCNEETLDRNNGERLILELWLAREVVKPFLAENFLHLTISDYDGFSAHCIQFLVAHESHNIIVRDEYGKTFTMSEFEKAYND